MLSLNIDGSLYTLKTSSVENTEYYIFIFSTLTNCFNFKELKLEYLKFSLTVNLYTNELEHSYSHQLDFLYKIALR